jgi:glycine hydroxymethyltransferase
LFVVGDVEDMDVLTGNETLLTLYLRQLGTAPVDSAVAAYYAALDHLNRVAPLVAQGIVYELRDQRNNLKLIASENYSSLATQLAHGNLLTDKYAEGYPGHRFYAGCDNVDAIETEAARLACQLFGAEHAYVQPHSGADANWSLSWLFCRRKYGPRSGPVQPGRSLAIA